jgi:ATP-binding cassette subfamily C protein LapB
VSSLATSEQRKLASTLTFWAQGVQQATYVAAVVAGTFMVFTGQFTVGTIIAVGILTSRTLGPLTQLASTLARWSNVKAALEALGEIADAEQDQDEDRQYLRREEMNGGFSNWVFGSSSFSFFLSGHCHSSGSRFSSQSG